GQRVAGKRARHAEDKPSEHDHRHGDPPHGSHPPSNEGDLNTLGQAVPNSSWNAGSPRSGSRSESPSAQPRTELSEIANASRRCAIASTVRPARLSQHATL